jgi:hypothetical protein
MKAVFCIALVSAALCAGAAARSLHALERWERADLTVRSIHLNSNKAMEFAWIADPDGYLHRLHAYDYVGKNAAVVLGFSRCEVMLDELSFLPDGSARLRHVTMELPDCVDDK